MKLYMSSIVRSTRVGSLPQDWGDPPIQNLYLLHQYNIAFCEGFSNATTSYKQKITSITYDPDSQ